MATDTVDDDLSGWIDRATYSPDDNKLRLYPSARLPRELYERVRGAGYIWAPKQEIFVAPMWTPDREDLAVLLAGDVNDEDTSLLDRAEDRAERFSEYEDHRAEDAQRARAAVSAIADHIPLGQPILVGHHSERHARKHAAQIENGMRRTIKMLETAQYWKHRAAGAIRHAKYKELPAVRARRIKGIEADQRKQQRAEAEARTWIARWGALNRPYKGDLLRPGVYEEGPPCDEALRVKRATAFANYDHISTPATEGKPYGSTLWSELDAGRMSAREAQLIALRVHGRTIARAKRWLRHYENRLVYERAMLDEQGATHLLAPKPKSAKAQLPLCNYRAPGGLQIENMYYKGEMIYYPQVEMTQAEYTAINQDYKGTRIVSRSHRVRTCLQKSALVCVFLTDAKVHAVPEERPVPALPLPTPRPMRERAPDTRQIELDQMREAARAGVQTVSAPTLFPTPPDLAQQVIALAEIREGDRVLEPSAGTGALASAVVTQTKGTLLCVEINHTLAQGLTRAGYVVQQADFLSCNGDLGLFDRIVMNPPFDHGSDITHIEHALKFLRDGGRLVAVCANGSRQRARFEPVAEAWIDLPPDTFKTAGTGVNTAIVVLTKGVD